MKGLTLSVDRISLHLDALCCGEDIFSLACLDEAFAISIGIPPLGKAIILFLHHGLSQVLVIHYMLISELVNPFSSCV